MWTKVVLFAESPVSMVSGLRTGSRLHRLGQLKLEHRQSLLPEPKEEFGTTTGSGKEGKILQRGTQKGKPQILCINSA